MLAKAEKLAEAGVVVDIVVAVCTHDQYQLGLLLHRSTQIQSYTYVL